MFNMYYSVIFEMATRETYFPLRGIFTGIFTLLFKPVLSGL